MDLAAKKAGLQQTFKHTQSGLTDKEKKWNQTLVKNKWKNNMSTHQLLSQSASEHSSIASSVNQSNKCFSLASYESADVLIN